MRICSLLSVIAVGVCAQAAAAHELWLEPIEYQVPAGGQLQSVIVNGETFDGTKLPYLPQRFVQFTVSVDGATTDVPGRPGDTPAMTMAAPDEGLTVVAFQSTVATLTYTEWAKFLKFSAHKDFPDIEARHDARGLPREGFKEAYTRFSKSLIGVGDAAGQDSRIGLETELVALTNPYTDDLSGGMQVQLFYGDDVRANEQVEVFDKAPSGEVEVTYVRTDADGIATIPVTPGHAYQLDAVVLREPVAAVAEQTGAVWETLWANITFAVPAS